MGDTKKKDKPSDNLNVPEDIPEEYYKGHDGTMGDTGSWWSDPEAMSSDLSPEQQEAIKKEAAKKVSSAAKSGGSS